MQRSGVRDLVVLVLDCERGVASQPDLAAASVEHGKPEIAHFPVDLFDLRVFRPERGIFRGRGLNAHHREVPRVHPNSTTIQQLVFSSWLDGQNVRGPSGQTFRSHQRELIVVLIERYAALVLSVQRFFLRLQHPVKYSVDDELGSMLRADGEILGPRRAVLHLDDHICASGAGEAAILETINASSLIGAERAGPFQIPAHHPGYDFSRCKQRDRACCWRIDRTGWNLAGSQPDQKRKATKRPKRNFHPLSPDESPKTCFKSVKLQNRFTFSKEAASRSRKEPEADVRSNNTLGCTGRARKCRLFSRIGMRTRLC